VKPKINVRRESPRESAAVRSVNEAAFGRSHEADLVDRLRTTVLASFVAEHDEQIVGHLLFSRIWIDTAGGPLAAVALAPMSVMPERQRQGVGGLLIRQGLDWLREQGEQVVLVLGHPNYYPRFGFSSHRTRALTHPFPPDAFMALELSPGALAGIRGSVRYPDAFGV
jgi:putative acetyltransferase